MIKRARIAVLMVFVLAFVNVTIASAAPTIEQMKFDPEQPVTGETLKLVIKIGGDALRAEILWRINDNEVARSDYDGLIPSLKLDHKINVGDKISATATPFDAIGTAGKTETKSVTVENAPPTAKLSDQKIIGNVYSAKITATDPEGGPITYSVNQGPDGLAIDQHGNVNWRLLDSTSGNFPVIIGVKDEKNAETLLQFSIGIKWQGGKK